MGVVLAHKMLDGSERPIGFASRTLKKVTLKLKKGIGLCIWSYQISRELDGYRHFELITDHKPLLSLFNEHKAIPSHASRDGH